MRFREHRTADQRSKGRLFSVEHLEDRTVPTARPLSGAVDFDSLRIDPNSYDASSILVRFHDGVDRLHADEVLPGTAIGKPSTLVSGLHIVQFEGVSVAEALSAYRASGLVQYAEPNYSVHVTNMPNDPLFASMYGLHNTGQEGGTTDADIDAPAAWDTATGSETVVVAVIDTGVDYTHPDLANNMWINPGETPDNGIDDDGNGVVDDMHGANVIGSGEPTNNLTDEYVHGTHVAGTIGAEGNNAIGVAGVAWDVEIMALKLFDVNGFGTMEDAIEAFEYVTRMRTEYGVNVRVASNSWRFGQYSQALYDAVEASGNAGILCVAAAGNDLADLDFNPRYPAAFDLPNVISVAATDRDDSYAWFTNYGATTVDLAAPGVDILSTLPGNSYGLRSGTSMATPHVSGAAALVWSEFPELTPAQVKGRLLSSVDDISDIPGNNAKPTLTNGRLNVQGALDMGDDLIPPAPVDDLAAGDSTLGSVTLTFTASGNDGLIGTADFYDIRFSTAPFVTEADFASASQITGEPSPQPPGSIETATISGLDFDTHYYFALKVVDYSGNASSLSNVASAGTQNAVIAFADDMENGAPGWNADGLWHLSTRRADSPVSSFYYGDENTGNYDTGVANSGSITSAAIDLTAATEAVLLFDEWRQVESFAPFDGAYLRLSSDGLNWTTVWADYVSTRGWTKRTVDVTPWVGSNLYVQFYFETVDDQFNFSEGWYVDDVTVLATGVNTPGLYVTDAFINEGQNGNATVSFTAQLFDVPGGASVSWQTADGSATVAGDDYEHATGMLTFGPGETKKTFTVVVNGDHIDEISESFFVNLSNAVGAVIVDGQAWATIVDDDSARISLSPFGLVTSENAGAVSVNVVLSSEPADNVTVALFSSDTSEGIASPMSLTFTPGNWNIAQTSTVSGVNDSIDDGDISYFVTAAAASDDPDYDGLAASTAAINQDNDLVTTYTSNVAKNIPDPGKVISTIGIAESRKIHDVNVRVNITHGRDQDLDVFLITPWGKRIKLFTDVGNHGNDFTNTILDDEAAMSITAGQAPFTDTFRPEGLLSAAAGHDTKGNWTLEITDDKNGGQKGKLIGWSLTFLVEQAAGAGAKAVSTSSRAAVEPAPENIRRINNRLLSMTGRSNARTMMFPAMVSDAGERMAVMSTRITNGIASMYDGDYVAKDDAPAFDWVKATLKAITNEAQGDGNWETNDKQRSGVPCVDECQTVIGVSSAGLAWMGVCRQVENAWGV